MVCGLPPVAGDNKHFVDLALASYLWAGSETVTSIHHGNLILKRQHFLDFHFTRTTVTKHVFKKYNSGEKLVQVPLLIP